MRARFRQAIVETPPGVHGSPDLEELRRLGVRPESVLDFSANLNPYGASPRVAEALAGAATDRYPDRHCGALRRAVAEHCGAESGFPLVAPENVLPGNGSSELIHLLAFAALEPGDCALIAGPTFCEYRRAAGLAGARVCEVSAGPPDFAPPIQALCRAARDERPRLVFLCNPNNPTGTYLDPAEIRRLRDAVCAGGGLLVLDEAYVDFVRHPWNCITEVGLGGLVVLRSLTKLHGLAGLRLGYALADPAVIEGLSSAQPPWSVNAFAQAAGAAALADSQHLERCREALLHEQEILRGGLAAAGYRTLPSTTTFFLTEVGDARAFRGQLLASGVLVRDCTSFGLPGHVRISARTRTEGSRLLAALPNRV